MKIYLLLIVAACILSACEKENLEITPTDELDAVAQVQVSDNQASFRKGGTPVTSGTTYTYDISNLTTCNNLYLPTMTNASSWTVGNQTQAGYIDYDLEQVFHCDPVFSGCTYRPPGPLVEQEIVVYELLDSGHEVFDPNLGFVTAYYLDNSISPIEADALKEHFACEILSTQPSRPNLSGKIVNVEFEGDALLCTCPSGQTHYLRATVTFNFYSQGINQPF
ncbi:hypothetical protein [Aureispira sp. CCB-QB1]|uniref:hypothetical protein n=1 Tax=Aureispira sp. CCB-QB1 TaxID=1313421 RepID=UPI0006979D27|nr:hypothetical protein [Aureispira sp. CCB-QB1]